MNFHTNTAATTEMVHRLRSTQPENTRLDRKVLVHKRELNRLRAKHEAERLTIVPISLYTSRGFVKLGFALARGKKKHEKRETLKKRDLDREIRARLKE